MSRLIGFLLGLATAVAAVPATLAGTAGIAQAEPCPDVQVVFARGTMEPPGLGATGQAFVDALRARVPAVVDAYPVNYPASLNFSTAADGVIDAVNKVRVTADTCPDTAIVLGGYSQGAAVAAYVTEDTIPEGYALPAGITGPLPEQVSEHVAAVALFGKPSTGFAQQLYNGAPPINIGAPYAAKTVELCAAGDAVCSPHGGDQIAHVSYPFNGMAVQAADFVVEKLAADQRFNGL